MWLLAAVAFLAFLICLFLIFVAIVPPYTGIIIARLGKPVRSAGPGPIFLFRPVEKIAASHSLQKRNLPFELKAETHNDQTGQEELVKLNISTEYEPSEKNLIEFLAFDQKQLESALKERLKAISSEEIEKRQDRDEVYENLAKIAEDIKTSFKNSKANGKTLEEHYGIKLIAVMIADPELPEELIKKGVELEAKAMEVEMQKIENERKKLEANNMSEIAASWVKKAAEHGQRLDFEVSLTKAQIQFDKVQEKHTQWGLNRGTLEAIKEIPPLLAQLCQPKESKEEKPVRTRGGSTNVRVTVGADSELKEVLKEIKDILPLISQLQKGFEKEYVRGHSR